MTEPQVSIGRDDVFWLMNNFAVGTVRTPEDADRLRAIEAAVEAQPYPKPEPFDLYVVHVPYGGEDGPIAVRTNVEEARTLTRVYNLNRADTHAVLLGYTSDSVGEGTVIPVD